MKREVTKPILKVRKSVRAVERAIDILMSFSRANQPLALSEISSIVGLHKVTVYRLLSSLQKKSFIVRDPETNRYRLGIALIGLTGSNLLYQEIKIRSWAEMKSLRDLTQETVSLHFLLNDLECLCISRCESQHELRSVTPEGQVLPLGRGAPTKLLLAYASHGREAQVIRDLKAIFGEHLLPGNKEAIIEELARIRREGFCVTVGERIPGAIGLAVPVRDFSGRVCAALTVVGPSSRLTYETLYRYLDSIRTAAERISSKLGYFPKPKARGRGMGPDAQAVDSDSASTEPAMTSSRRTNPTVFSR